MAKGNTSYDAMMDGVTEKNFKAAGLSNEDLLDLLKLRYKVIADYPGNTFKVGTILKDNGWGKWLKYGDRMINTSTADLFPHLFKKLEWWEEREEKDMPEYLKSTEDEEVFKVTKYTLSIPCFYTGEIEKKGRWKGFQTPFNLRAMLPATKEEYENKNFNSAITSPLKNKR